MALERLEKAMLQQIISKPLGAVCDLVLLMNGNRSLPNFRYVYNQHLQQSDEINALMNEVKERINDLPDDEKEPC